jgi:hypothetical protein
MSDGRPRLPRRSNPSMARLATAGNATRTYWTSGGVQPRLPDGHDDDAALPELADDPRRPRHPAAAPSSAGAGSAATHGVRSAKQKRSPHPRGCGGRAGSQEAAAGYRAGVGDVLADAAEPAAAAVTGARGADRLGEAAQAFIGVRGSGAVALVVFARGAGDLGGDGLGRAVVCRTVAGSAVVEAA